MINVIGVRFRKAGKIYYFEKNGLDYTNCQNVIVETARGIEYGHVMFADKAVSEEELVQPLKPVIRCATAEDDQIYQENQIRSKEAFAICKEKIVERGLEMKLVDSEYTFDRNKLLFYFTADDRVDFRDLVKDLATIFRTRIELRQIGVRDEAKMIPSIGGCGRTLCCGTFLSNFHPVSIKMAKDQNLSLSPSKISGICGRLLCCLQYEQETYEQLNKISPREGDLVKTPTGVVGEVQYVNILRQQVKVVIKQGEDVEIIQYDVKELERLPRSKKDNRPEKTEKLDTAELAKLEDGGEKKSNRRKNQSGNKS
ncbi:stage 0 sporulation protein [Clostridiales bacterium COT073_COT-073]|nr:stage 0 sporulation protein [Clostridiales bacterium COT073_COT-073]